MSDNIAFLFILTILAIPEKVAAAEERNESGVSLMANDRIPTVTSEDVSAMELGSETPKPGKGGRILISESLNHSLEDIMILQESRLTDELESFFRQTAGGGGTKGRGGGGSIKRLFWRRQRRRSSTSACKLSSLG